MVLNISPLCPSSSGFVIFVMACMGWPLISLPLAVIFVPHHYVYDGHGLLELNRDNFPDFTAKRNVAMIMLVKDDCPWCNFLKPSFSRAADKLFDDYGGQVLGLLNVDQNSWFTGYANSTNLPRIDIIRKRRAGGSAGSSGASSRPSRLSGESDPKDIVDAFDQEFEQWRKASGKTAVIEGSGGKSITTAIVDKYADLRYALVHDPRIPTFCLIAGLSTSLVLATVSEGTNFERWFSQTILRQAKANPSPGTSIELELVGRGREGHP